MQCISTTPRPWLAWVILYIGLIMAGLGISLMIRAQIGLGPWDVLHQGISKQTGISIGMSSILIAVPIMLFWLPLGERPGVGTISNILLIGITIDIWLKFLPPITQLPTQLIQMIGAIILMGVGSGLYLSADLGAGPRDGLMMGLVRKTGLSVRLIRTFIEVLVLTLGWLMGGNVGIGTVIFAFGIGPVVQTTLDIMRHRTITPKRTAESCQPGDLI